VGGAGRAGEVKRYILTGAPGAGKTAILRQLSRDGCSVVEEAATDVIAQAQARGTAEPWMQASFLDEVARVQQERQLQAAGEVQFHDRSVVCTAALAIYLGRSVSPFLADELERVRNEKVFERRVFFIRNLGFVTPTAARRISFEETVRFEKIHEDVYREFGFELFPVEPGIVTERVSAILGAIRS
jgi:predicted ATPase